MQTEIQLALKEAALANREKRIEMMRNSLGLFIAYYFGAGMTYKFPGYVGEFWQDGENLTDGYLREAVWIGFAESTKTTNAKMLAAWWIATAQKHYINFDSWDKKIAEQSLFDLTLWLQTNTKLRKDFGELYIEERHDREKKQLKRLGEFITTNDIKVEAFSIGISPRGRIYNNYRPDAYIMDDLENNKTIRSSARTKQIIDHVDEVKRGLGPTGCILYCGNYISDAGVMRHIRDRVAADPKGVVRDVPVVDRITGEIAWKDKYVHTDEEAARINADPSRRHRPVISLEDKKRFLKEKYEPEMMNDPAATGELVFDRPTIDRLLRNVMAEKQDNGGLKVWYAFNPSHRYAIGADTAEGEGGDANASVIIDFSTTPNRVVATYASNMISADLFGHELKRQGYLYGECLVCPEVNNTGFATLAALKNVYKHQNIYRREEQDKVQKVLTKKLGWRTTEGNKYSIMSELKTAVENGELIVFDKRLLDEMREFTNNDMRDVQGLVTRHFDLLKACALAWAMRSLAKVTEQNTTEYRQPKYEGQSAFEGSGFGQKGDSEDLFDMFDEDPFLKT